MFQCFLLINKEHSFLKHSIIITKHVLPSNGMVISIVDIVEMILLFSLYFAKE